MTINPVDVRFAQIINEPGRFNMLFSWMIVQSAGLMSPCKPTLRSTNTCSASPMRSLLAAFLLLLASPHSHAEDDPNYLYAITFAGGFAMTRFAKPDFVEAQRKSRPDCIVVNWTYAPSALDTDGELKSIRDSANTAVEAELTRDPNAIVTAKTFRADTSLWIICTSAGQEFVTGVQARLQSLANSKYEVRLARDPEWSVLSNYVKLLREKQ